MQVFSTYFTLGLQHILDLAAYDHMLFIAVLIVGCTLKHWKETIILATAFTLGHSLTLALAVTELIRVPSDLIETLIPVTIFVTAAWRIIKPKSNIQGVKIEAVLVALFGLIHGMGFSNFLRMTLSENQSLAVSLLGFNAGVEFGQIIILLIMLLIQSLVFFVVKKPSFFLIWNRGLAVAAGLISLSLLFS